MSLQAAVKAVLPHASTDKTLPILNAAHVKHGTVIATDRYTVGESTWDAGAIDPFEPFTLAAPDAKRLAGLKSAVYDVKVIEDRIEILHADGALVFFSVGGDYPPAERLFPDDGAAAGEASGVLLNPEFLARFRYTHLARGREEKSMGLRMTFQADRPSVRPILVEFSNHFRGLIVPMRPANS